MKGRQRLDLSWELTHCNVTGRHKESLPGIDWSSAYPLLLLLLLKWFATGRLAPSVLLILSLNFFPVSLYPVRWHPLLALNPLVWMIEQMRALVIGGLGLLRKGSLGFC